MQWRTGQIPGGPKGRVHASRVLGDGWTDARIECYRKKGRLIRGTRRLEPDRSRALEGGHFGEGPPSFRAAPR